MKRRFQYILTAIVCLNVAAVAHARIDIYDMERIDKAREAYKAGDARVVRVIDGLKAMAETFLVTEDPYVTAKKVLPPSGDPRDYMTMSPYWWPDPDKADGLPYIRRDGERNPEVNNYPERESAGLMGTMAEDLGLLYYFTGEKKYAEKCASVVRTWFLDPEKGMNPNMTYGQSVPGMKNIRGTGIVEARKILYAFGGINLIRGSEFWTENDDRELEEWARAFCYWLDHSIQGRKENLQANNHGYWYQAARLLCMSMYEKPEKIAWTTEHQIAPWLDIQIYEDGCQPKELVRTRSLHYSTFALEALICIARIARNAGYDLWKYTSINDRSMELAVDFMLPYYLDPAQWPYRQIVPFERSAAAGVLYDAGLALDREDLLKAAKEIGYKQSTFGIESLYYFEITQQ